MLKLADGANILPQLRQRMLGEALQQYSASDSEEDGQNFGSQGLEATQVY
jgi:hypothetical protein